MRYLVLLILFLSCSDSSPQRDKAKTAFEILPIDLRDLPYKELFTTEVQSTWLLDKDSIFLLEHMGDTIYHATAIAQRALNFLHKYFEYRSYKHALQQTEKYASKLLDMSEEIDSALFFPIQFDFRLHHDPQQQMIAPWYSGLTQGQCFLIIFREVITIAPK